MASDYPRSHRVADFIQRELSGLIQRELKDPRVSPMLTITSVEVSRDLSVAKVYYTLLNADEQADTGAALKSASGFLRGQLARSMNTRSVPELRFHFDDSAATGARMSALIASAVATNTTVSDDVTSDACHMGAATEDDARVDAAPDAADDGDVSDADPDAVDDASSAVVDLAVAEDEPGGNG